MLTSAVIQRPALAHSGGPEQTWPRHKDRHSKIIIAATQILSRWHSKRNCSIRPRLREYKSGHRNLFDDRPADVNKAAGCVGRIVIDDTSLFLKYSDHL